MSHSGVEVFICEQYIALLDTVYGITFGSLNYNILN